MASKEEKKDPEKKTKRQSVIGENVLAYLESADTDVCDTAILSLVLIAYC